MKLGFHQGPPKRGETAVRFLTTEQLPQLPPGIPSQEFSASPNALLFLRESSTLYVGLGDEASLDSIRLREAAGTAARHLKSIGRLRLAFHLEQWPQWTDQVVEGALLADYQFDQFTPRKNTPLESARILVLAGALKSATRSGHRAHILADSINQARAIGNLPGNLLYPETLARKVAALAKRFGLRCTILAEPQLRAGKFGGLLAVGSGSQKGPRLILLEHRGGPKRKAPIALVGKAVTFDSGGISIKPAANMEDMIFDKCGGIAVLGTLIAAARLGIKTNLIGLIPSAENLPSHSAYRPGDIITTYGGKHIEVVNTDAEGRLLLADALAFANAKYRPSALIDLATLTGACGVALGEHAAGLWSNNDLLRDQLMTASAHSGERLWPMPSFPEYRHQIRSKVALLKNSGGRLGGACTAAAFLEEFARPTPWAHIDIAYTSHRDRDQPHIARGATGFGIRLLSVLLEAVATA